MSKISGIILLIAVLLCVTLIRNTVPSFEGQPNRVISKNTQPVKSNEILLKNVAIEAVMPFIHIDLLHHFVITPFIFLSSDATGFITLASPEYINKYLKNLFLFIISTNAP